MAEYINKRKAHIYCADSMLAGDITKEEADLIDDFLEGCSTIEIVHCEGCKYNKWCVKQMYIVNRPKQGKRKNGFEKYDNLYPEVDFCSFGGRGDEEK